MWKVKQKQKAKLMEKEMGLVVTRSGELRT